MTAPHNGPPRQRKIRSQKEQLAALLRGEKLTSEEEAKAERRQAERDAKRECELQELREARERSEAAAKTPAALEKLRQWREQFKARKAAMGVKVYTGEGDDEGEKDNGGADVDAVGAVLLADVCNFLGRFVAYPSEHARIAHALWIAHTHLMALWESTPRIAFLSPEPGSGKTRALEVSELLVPHPVEAINATAAYLFRKISDADGLPTILFDEIDTLFGVKAREHEEVRGVLNAGHRRGAVAGRCVVVGKTVKTEELPAYCAVALAGLGNLPDTILTRSVIVKMRRRAPTETIEPFRRRLYVKEGHELRERIARWTDSIRPAIEGVYPQMPQGVDDRAADLWEALLTIADAAGGDWPTVARVSAVTLVTDARTASPSLGIRLLADLRTVFAGEDAMFTADILSKLTALDESPWGDLRGKPLDARGLSRLLVQYEVRRTTVRIGHLVGKGYKRDDLHDAWQRYIGVAAKESVTSVTPVTPPAEDLPDWLKDDP
jgi:hypothetical protein